MLKGNKVWTPNGY
jgi:hypothetical protein